MIKKAGICVLSLILLLLSCIIGPVPNYAAETAAEEDPVISIEVPFLNGLRHMTSQWDFPYSDAFFRKPSDEFSIETARASMGLTVSAFRNHGELINDQYETYLKAAGFTDIYAYGYDRDPGVDTVSVVIAHKQIDDFVLIAAVPCGQGYKKEWGGNLEVGDEERHVGFNKGAAIMGGQIEEYIRTHDLNGKKKLWLSGFSRAAAVSNLTAADMIGSGQFEDVYAYLFGVPRTTKVPVPYKGIYNICGKYDPVPQIPMASWGYERYGTDLYTPAEETDINYAKYVTYCSNVNISLGNPFFQNNPEVNFQIHTILEFLSEMFPTSKDYAERFQDTLMSIWTEANPDSIGMILTQAMQEFAALDERAANSSDIFLDYLAFIMSQHLAEEQRQVEAYNWNPDQSIAENVLREHMPYTYIDWLFSGLSTEELFYGPQVTRRVVISGPADVEVWLNDYLVQGVDMQGKVYSSDDMDHFGNIESLDEFFEKYPNVFIMRNGTDTVTCLPMDKDFRLLIRVREPATINYFDVMWDPAKTFSTADTIHVINAAEGEYILEVSHESPLPGLKNEQGEPVLTLSMDFDYSPAAEMTAESSATDHFTIQQVIALLFNTIMFILIILLVSLVIFIVHAVKKKKTGQTYSPWFVIVPHLALIYLLLVVTRFVSVNMFSIANAEIVNAALITGLIFLLALRGLLRNRSIRNLIICIAFLVLTIANFLLFKNKRLLTSSVWNFILYCVLISVAAAIAVSTFFFTGDKTHSIEDKVTLKDKSKDTMARFRSDTDFSTAVLSSGTSLISLIFAIYNGFLGIYYQSLWHGSICVYYILLTLIRLYILFSEKRILKRNEDITKRRQRTFVVSNIILLIINISMILPTALMVTFGKPAGMTLIPALAMAVYTTIKVISAIRRIKHRSESDNLLIRELWTISVVDAALSIISLQNTLIMVAGDPNDRSLFVLSAISSGVIIAATIALEVFFFVSELKKLKHS